MVNRDSNLAARGCGSWIGDTSSAQPQDGRPLESQSVSKPPTDERRKMKRRWSIVQLEKHCRKNTTEEAGTYSAAVVIAALFKKLYGRFPRIGLSGAQAEFADSVIPLLPKRQVNDPDEC